MCVPEDIKIKYLHRRVEEVSFLQEHLVNKDFSAICFFSHKIKGTAASFGFAELGEIAASMERAAEEKNSEDLFELAKKYVSLVGQLNDQGFKQGSNEDH